MSSAGTQSNSNKRTYKAVTALDRLRITEAFDTRSAADAYTLAESLGINKETARSILRKYIKTGEQHAVTKGGKHYSKVDQEMLNYLEELLSQNSQLTLQTLNVKLRAKY